MFEFLEIAFSGVNIAYTLLLVLLLVYWCIVLLGILDLDMLDIDIDSNVDIDADTDTNMNGLEGGFSWLAFFNVGEVPIMLYATIVVLTMWVISIEMNLLLDRYAADWAASYRAWIALVMAVPILIFSLLVAKVIVFPIKKMRQRPPQTTKLEGEVCLVTSARIDGTYGRCEMPKRHKSLILNARTRDGEILQKGDAAEIVEHVHNENAKEDYYIVTKKTWDKPE